MSDAPILICRHCGDSFHAPVRDCPSPDAGRTPYADSGRGGHRFDPLPAEPRAPMPPERLQEIRALAALGHPMTANTLAGIAPRTLGSALWELLAEYDERSHLTRLCNELETREQVGRRGSEGPEAQTRAAEQVALRKLMNLPARTAETAAGDADLRYWAEGTKLIEECLAQALRADPDDVPFPLVGNEAKLWHSASASAYQHALEMMGRPTVTTPEDSATKAQPETKASP